MTLKTGKLPIPVLKKLLRHKGAEDSRVILGPSIGEDAAFACTDKVEMRRRWAKAGIPVLPWAEARDAATVEVCEARCRVLFQI